MKQTEHSFRDFQLFGGIEHSVKHLLLRFVDFCAYNNDNNNDHDDKTDYFNPCACAWGNEEKGREGGRNGREVEKRGERERERASIYITYDREMCMLLGMYGCC